MLSGDLYRLLNPFEGNEAAWMVVSGDSEEAFVFYCRVLAEPNAGFRTLRLQGLKPDASYEIDEGKQIYGGDELMYNGIRIPFHYGDFQSKVWKLKMIK